MSKEIAKKLIAELQTNEELRAKIAGIKDPAEMVKKAVEAGYDVTLEEMLESEREYKAEMAQKSDELTADELEGAAGGGIWTGDDAVSDGHELGCAASYHHYDYQNDNNIWCNQFWYCQRGHYDGSCGGKQKVN